MRGAGIMPDPYDWAVRFETQAKEMMLAGDTNRSSITRHLGPDALLSIPTPDHYLPLLYVIGASAAGRTHHFPGRRHRRRISFDAGGADRMTGAGTTLQRSQERSLR